MELRMTGGLLLILGDWGEISPYPLILVSSSVKRRWYYLGLPLFLNKRKSGTEDLLGPHPSTRCLLGEGCADLSCFILVYKVCWGVLGSLSSSKLELGNTLSPLLLLLHIRHFIPELWICGVASGKQDYSGPFSLSSSFWLGSNWFINSLIFFLFYVENNVFLLEWVFERNRLQSYV